MTMTLRIWPMVLTYRRMIRHFMILCLRCDKTQNSFDHLMTEWFDGFMTVWRLNDLELFSIFCFYLSMVPLINR